MDGARLPGGRVVVVGPGRVGTVLAAALSRSHRIVGAAGGSQASRDRFARRLAGSRTSAEPAELVPGADLVVIATPDDALEPVVRALAAVDAFREGQRVVHVAGSHGLAPLRLAAAAGARVAACHPAQTVPAADASPDVLIGSAWAVTAGDADRGWAHDLVVQAGGQPFDVAEDVRTLYHAALVVGANATGAVTAVARQLLLAARVGDPAAFLAPLIEASVANVLRDGAAALTGPVRRGDAGTIGRHVSALDQDLPELGRAYRHLSEVVLAQVAADLDDEQRAALAGVLREEERP